jgi:ankyrin repeat protein
MIISSVELRLFCDTVACDPHELSASFEPCIFLRLDQRRCVSHRGRLCFQTLTGTRFPPLDALATLVDNTVSLFSLLDSLSPTPILDFLLFLLLLQYGDTPLHFAAYTPYFNPETVCDLIAAGANPDLKDNVSAPPPTPQPPPCAGVECPLQCAP